MKRDISVKVDLPHPPRKVWRALTEPALIEQWMMPTTFEPKVGNRFVMRDKPRPGWNGVVEGQVLEIEPERRLVYTWERGQGEKTPTTVVFTLAPIPAGTRLRVDHKNFTGLSAVVLSYVLAGGWKKMITERLPKVVMALPN